MKKTTRIMMLLLLAMVSTGQASARLRGLGYIAYTSGANDGGSLTFYKEADCINAINIDGTTHKSDYLSIDDLTERTVYIKATAAPGYTALGVTFTVTKTISSTAIQAPRRSPDIAEEVAVTPVGGKPGIYQFTMPDDAKVNVSVSAQFAEPEQQQVSYVDENYDTQEVSAYVLDETMRVLPAGFYVVPDGLTLDRGIQGYGSGGTVTIIIPDGKMLAMGSANSPISGYAFGMGHSLSFYGQTNATGKLVINAATGGVSIGGSVKIAHLDVEVVCESSGFSPAAGCTFAGHQTKGNTLKVHSAGGGVSGGASSVTIKNYDVDIFNENSNYAISAAGSPGVTIEGFATGDKVNSVIVRSNYCGIVSGGNSVTIKYCNVEITGATKTGNVYDACSSQGIDATGGVTITGRADTNNTLKIRSGGDTNSSFYAINGGPSPITISRYDADIVCENGNGIYTSGNVTITGGQVEVIGGTGKDGIYSGTGDITLGWINTTDYIKASSYFFSGNKAMQFADGQRFVAYNMADATDISATAIVSGAINGTDDTLIGNLAGRTLKPLVGNYVKVDNANVSIVENNAAKAADFTINDIPYYIYSQDDAVTLSNSLSTDACTYRVNGSAIAGNTFTVTGDATVTADWKTTVAVSAVWNDNNNVEGFRPTNITVKLLANDEEAGAATLDADNNWQYTWEDLLKYENGQEIVYTVAEDQLSYYNAPVIERQSQTEWVYTVTNSRDLEETEARAIKVWDDNDNAEGFRPDDVTINLVANGVIIDTQTLSDENNWNCTWSPLQKYINGQAVNYTVTENPEAYYTTRITKATDGSFTYTVTNSRSTEKTLASIEIVWEDDDNSANLRPANVTAKVMANGKKAGTATLEATDNWQYTWEDLQKYADATEITYSSALVNTPNYYVVKSTETTGNTTTLTLELCVELNETDGVTALTALGGAAVPVRFSRTFNAGKASTVCLPFEYTKGTEGDYYTFSGVKLDLSDGKWKAEMHENTATTLAANTPYLFMPAGTEGTVNVVFQGTAATTVKAGATDYNDWTFKGIYTNKTWAAADCGYDYGFAATSGKATDGVTDVAAGDFVRFAEGAFIKPMRAYLTYSGTVNPWTSNAPGFRSPNRLPETISVILVKADGTTTSLNEELRMKNEECATASEWYTLDGIKLDGKPTKKGLYIHNGRKVVMK